jgi:hypothetical protein
MKLYERLIKNVNMTDLSLTTLRQNSVLSGSTSRQRLNWDTAWPTYPSFIDLHPDSYRVFIFEA